MVVPARLERATPAFGRRCSAPLSYGTETIATHDVARNWSGWLDSNQRPPASEAGTLAGLSYTLLALRREIESLSPDRQSGRLTRCVTERDRNFASLLRLARNRIEDMNWCVWADSNGHCMRSQRIPSANWGTDAWFIVGWVECLRDPTSNGALQSVGSRHSPRRRA